MGREIENHSLLSRPLCYFILIFQVDPVRTISAGKVNLGAFRTYPKVS